MKRVVSFILCIASVLALTGCSFATLSSERVKGDGEMVRSVEKLKTEKLYVCKNTGNSKKEKIKTITKDNQKFYQARLYDYNFAGKELDEANIYNRNIWVFAEDKETIPVVTSKDSLLYISKTNVPREVVFERFYVSEPSVGVCNLSDDGGGHYFITYIDMDADDYKYSIHSTSDAGQLEELAGAERVYVDKVGGVSVTKDNVDEGGVITGLKQNESYVMELYTGTFYQDFKVVADTINFRSMERFVSNDFTFLHSNCIEIGFPDYLKSGYYMVNGLGLICYLADGDSLEAVDFNDPIIIRDEYGFVVIDPSQGIDKTKELEAKPAEEPVEVEESEEQENKEDEEGEIT